MGRFFKHDETQADFCVIGTPPEHRLSQFERLTLVGGRELDRALAHIGRQISRFSGDDSIAPFDRSAVEAAHRFYTNLSRGGALHDFFQPPPGGTVVRETEVHGLSDGFVVDLTFESPFSPHNRDLQGAFGGGGANRTAHARWWRHANGGAATVVAVHGWTMGDQRLNSLAFLPGIFYRLGLDVVLFELPFHGRRRDSSASGHGGRGFLFPSSDLALTNEAMAQAISDLRALRVHLERRGAKEIGCIGMSLGAYVSALWASLDEVAFCIPVVPLVSMSELAWDMARQHPRLNAAGAGVTPELLEAVFRLHCPLSYSLRIPRDRVFIVAALGDHIVPTRQPTLLWEHWGKPPIEWVSGGHDTLFQRSKAFAQVCSFLEHLKYIKPAFSADLHPGL